MQSWSVRVRIDSNCVRSPKGAYGFSKCHARMSTCEWWSSENWMICHLITLQNRELRSELVGDVNRFSDLFVLIRPTTIHGLLMTDRLHCKKNRFRHTVQMTLLFLCLVTKCWSNLGLPCPVKPLIRVEWNQFGTTKRVSWSRKSISTWCLEYENSRKSSSNRRLDRQSWWNYHVGLRWLEDDSWWFPATTDSR